jgi:N-acetylglucosaminyldiphosphoundecaprenol N-acetyl-beta-D-mannosaminyltransferase
MTGKRFTLAEVAIDNLDFRQVLSEIGRLLTEGRGATLFTPNAAHIALFQADPEFKRAYQRADLVTPDSVPLLWASRLLGQPLKERCSGSDLFAEVCSLAASLDKKIFLLGGRSGSEKIAEKKLLRTHHGLRVASSSPPFGFESDSAETARIIAAINDFRTDLLLICVGTPKSEKWLFRNRERLDFRLACSFGMALELFAGKEKRAPRRLQRAGLEWSWRLARDPRRLAKRYVVGNSVFIGLVLRQWLQGRRPKRYRSS